jgi:hypothetical protein
VPHSHQDDAADNQDSHDQKYVQHNHEYGVALLVCWLVGTAHEVFWFYRQQQFVVMLLRRKTPGKANSELISELSSAAMGSRVKGATERLAK